METLDSIPAPPPPPSRGPVLLLEIEKELAGPNHDAALARHDAVLASLARRLDDALRQGLPPDEYARAEALREANTTARKILRLAARVGGGA